MLIGADLGSKQVKTSTMKLFDNRISTIELLNSTNHRIEIGGITYYIGEGEYETEVNKAERPSLLVSLFAAIALSSNDVTNQVVVGLPIQHYHAQKQRLSDYISENRIQDIILDGEEKRQIIITDVAVAPEGVSAYHSLNDEVKEKIGNQDLVIIDIGGRTTDICLYKLEDGKRRIAKYESIMVGMLSIYDSFIKAINAAFTLDKDLEDAEYILKNGLYVKGEKQDITFTKSILVKHVQKIFKTLNMNFSVESRQPLLVGGGGMTLNGLFKKKLPHILMANEPLFGNAIGFAKVGEGLWNS